MHRGATRETHHKLRRQKLLRLGQLARLHVVQKAAHQRAGVRPCGATGGDHPAVALVGAGVVHHHGGAGSRRGNHRAGSQRHALHQAGFSLGAVAWQQGNGNHWHVSLPVSV
ncbi:MAG: hypothetical protein EBQ71_16170 [Betaproteobacteria bacterium]|nr:hypothetical protein [Betaproteobacteria bacterium]